MREIVGNPWKPLTLPPAEYSRFDGAEVRTTPILSRHRYATPTVLSLAQAAHDERVDNKEAIKQVEKDIETQRDIMNCCTSDSAYRIYQQHIDEFQKKLKALQQQPDGTLDPVTLLALADALEEAGCTDQAILEHLRPLPCVWCGASGVAPWHTTSTGISTDPIPCSLCGGTGRFGRQPAHVRGCWALDLILGTS